MFDEQRVPSKGGQQYLLRVLQVDRKQQIYWLGKAADGGVPKALFELVDLQHK